MSRFIELSLVLGPTDPHERHAEVEVDREGEDDGIVEVAPATAVAPTERTSPTMVQVELIRNFYPRKKRSDGVQPVGTRITFLNGSGAAVTEPYEVVKAMVNPN